MPKRAYNRPIEIQENQATQTGLRPTADWVTVLNAWASIEPISASEQFRHGQNVGEATHVVRMRYWDELTAKHRIKYTDRNGTARYLGILGPPRNEDEAGRYLEMICKEG